MKGRKTWIGAAACGLIGWGALSEPVSAATPEVLKQTAIICDNADPNNKCLPIGNTGHGHEAVRESEMAAGRRFKVNPKLILRYLRFFDLQGEAFDEMERPRLHMIHPWQQPLSGDSLEFSGDCWHSNFCVRLKDFPFAFSIRDLKNDNGTVTPHAFVYLPFRLNPDLDPRKGDGFFIFVLHIAESECECNQLKTLFGRRHCNLLRRLSLAWSTNVFSRKAMRELIATEYRHLLDHIFDDFLAASAQDPKFDEQPKVVIPSAKGLALNLDLLKSLWVEILLHNDIIHGDLQ